jgi:hypothetical protein
MGGDKGVERHVPRGDDTQDGHVENGNGASLLCVLDLRFVHADRAALARCLAVPGDKLAPNLYANRGEAAALVLAHSKLDEKLLTNSGATDRRASGHHLWYFHGGGAKAGFQVLKRVSQAACGLPVRDDQPDAFGPVAGLSAYLPAR